MKRAVILASLAMSLLGLAVIIPSKPLEVAQPGKHPGLPRPRPSPTPANSPAVRVASPNIHWVHKVWEEVPNTPEFRKLVAQIDAQLPLETTKVAVFGRTMRPTPPPIWDGTIVVVKRSDDAYLWH